MYKVQFRYLGSGAWNLSALPTSLQIATGQALVASRQPAGVEVRLIEAHGAHAPAAHPVDIRI